ARPPQVGEGGEVGHAPSLQWVPDSGSQSGLTWPRALWHSESGIEVDAYSTGGQAFLVRDMMLPRVPRDSPDSSGAFGMHAVRCHPCSPEGPLCWQPRA